MGGKSPPPPQEPDYSAQKAEYVTKINQERADQAKTYNQNVANWNQNIAGQAGTLSNLQSQLQGLTIRDDEKFNDFGTQISSFKNTVPTLKWTGSAPQWSSTVNSPYAGKGSSVVEVNVPTLDNPNTAIYDSLSSGASTLESQLANLRSQRSAEEQRIQSYFNPIQSSYAQLESRMRGYSPGSFASEAELRDYDAQLADLNARATNFSSSILDEVFDTNQLGTKYNSLTTSLNDLRGARQGELDRIGAFRSQQESDAANLRTKLQGATIADETLLNEIRDTLDAERRQTRGFSSSLNPDFNIISNDYTDVEGRLNSLYGQRSSEQARLNQILNAANATATDVAGNASSASFYDLPTIQNLQRQIQSARSNISGANPLLPVDFSTAQGNLATSETALQNLLGQRQTELDRLTGKATELSNLDGIALQDETAIQNRRRGLESAYNEISNFYGNDLSDERAKFTSAFEAIDTRVQELADKRSEIESRAQALLAQLQSGSYADLGALSPFEAQQQAIKTEQELYKATAALDEIDQIAAKLNSERARVERDIAAREAAARREQQGTAQYVYGTTSLNPNLQGLSPEQIAFLLSTGRQDNQNGQFAPQQPGGFSRNVLVV